MQAQVEDDEIECELHSASEELGDCWDMRTEQEEEIQDKPQGSGSQMKANTERRGDGSQA